ncbi:MAG: hypothetical protein HUJ63_00310 [Enterococcus sp.]|nr:hypothetical protein [Enterococcus sp.]
MFNRKTHTAKAPSQSKTGEERVRFTPRTIGYFFMSFLLVFSLLPSNLTTLASAGKYDSQAEETAATTDQSNTPSQDNTAGQATGAAQPSAQNDSPSAQADTPSNDDAVWKFYIDGEYIGFMMTLQECFAEYNHMSSGTNFRMEATADCVINEEVMMEDGYFDHTNASLVITTAAEKISSSGPAVIKRGDNFNGNLFECYSFESNAKFIFDQIEIDGSNSSTSCGPVFVVAMHNTGNSTFQFGAENSINTDYPKIINNHVANSTNLNKGAIAFIDDADSKMNFEMRCGEISGNSATNGSVFYNNSCTSINFNT